MTSTLTHQDHYGPPVPRVAISVCDGPGKELVTSAIRESGATPILLSSLADIPSVSDVCVGAVCDLAPWNEVVLEQFHEVRRAAPLELIILYVPEEQLEIAEPLDASDPAVRCCIQDASPEAIAGFQGAVAWMIQSGASSILISQILEGRSPVNPTSMRFLWWAVRAVGEKRRGPVTDGAASLGVATRTLGRRLRDAGLPPPVELYGWIKLLAVAWTAERTQTQLGKAARIFHLNAMGLFHLKTRLLKADQLTAVRTSKNPLSIVIQGFRERCLRI